VRFVYKIIFPDLKIVYLHNIYMMLCHPEFKVRSHNRLLIFLNNCNQPMKKLFLFLIFSALSLVLSAQKPGYIHTDTAYVPVDIFPLTDAKAAKKCIARFNNRVHFVTYEPSNILGYSFRNKIYQTITIKAGNDSAKTFLQVIVSGDLPVYYLKDKKGKHFYITDESKSLIELVKKNNEYKKQLRIYFKASAGTSEKIYTEYSRQGIKRRAEILKDPLMLRHQPWIHLTLQSGITMQQLTIRHNDELPAEWKKFNPASATFSVAADVPLLKYRPFTYHQEVRFNKFVSNMSEGSTPPEYQLIQNFSVLSIPAMLRYTFYGEKLKLFVNTGFQLDIALNKENVRSMIVKYHENEASEIIFENWDYRQIQPGFTGGFGVLFLLNSKFALCSELRYSGVPNLLPGKAGFENQYSVNAGIVYSVYRNK